MALSPLRSATAERAIPPSATTVLASLIASAWGLALLVVFLQHRGDDVGQLPSLVRAFRLSLRGPHVASVHGILQILAAELVAAAIVGSWLGFGGALMRLAPRWFGSGAHATRSGALDVARRFGLGAGACSLTWFGLGVAGLYRPVAAMVVAGIGVALLAWTLPRAPRFTRGPTVRLAPVEWVALLLVFFPLALAAMAALAPPTAKDALIYHRALPKAFVAGGGLVDVPFNIAAFFALGAEMHGLWAMLLGSVVDGRVAEMAFGAVEFAFFPLLLLALYGSARQIGLDRPWALTAAALFASIPTAYTVATNGYVDVALALFATLTIEAAAAFWATGERAALARLASFLGFALMVKHTAIFLLVPMPLVILLRARRLEQEPGADSSGARDTLLAGAIALGCAVLVGTVWYARTWIWTGSPLFPFYMDLWPGHAIGWDRDRSALAQALFSAYGSAHQGVLDYVITPLRLSLLGQPENPTYYEGVLGISFLFGLPVVLWVACRRALPSAATIAAGVAALMYGQWLVSLQGLRYLLPVLSLLVLVLVSAGDAVGTRLGATPSALRWALLGGALAGQLVITSWFLEQNPVRVVLGGEPRTAYLARRLDYYPYYALVNAALPATSRVWLVNMRRDTYHIDRPYFSDYLFEDYTLRTWVENARDVRALRTWAREAGITHVLVRHDVLFDPARSPIVDDRRSDAINRTKMAMLMSFLLDGTTVLRRDGKFLLVALPTALPPDVSAARQAPATPRP